MTTQTTINFESPSPVNKEKLSGQNKELYDMLQNGNITLLDAIKAGIYHCHSRISDLRNKSKVKIYDRMVQVNGISCKEYSLKEFKQD